MSGPYELDLYVKRDCHLCDEMAADLEPWRDRLHFDLALVEIDDDPGLRARYGHKVPVLTDGSFEICHFFFDEAALRAHIVSPPSPGFSTGEEIGSVRSELNRLEQLERELRGALAELEHELRRHGDRRQSIGLTRIVDSGVELAESNRRWTLAELHTVARKLSALRGRLRRLESRG